MIQLLEERCQPVPILQRHHDQQSDKRRCVQTEAARLFGVESPRPRIEPVRIANMSSSNSWAESASMFRRTGDASLEHENGDRAQALDALGMEGPHAPIQ
jgi:hypothetical protein